MTTQLLSIIASIILIQKSYLFSFHPWNFSFDLTRYKLYFLFCLWSLKYNKLGVQKFEVYVKYYFTVFNVTTEYMKGTWMSWKPHLNVSDLETRMTKKDMEELKVLPIPTSCTFVFGCSIRSARLNMFCFNSMLSYLWEILVRWL